MERMEGYHGLCAGLGLESLLCDPELVLVSNLVPASAQAGVRERKEDVRKRG